MVYQKIIGKIFFIDVYALFGVKDLVQKDHWKNLS